MLCCLFSFAEKLVKESQDLLGGKLLAFILAYPNPRAWANVQQCAAERQASYDAFAEFVAQAAFASPPVTLAGFTTGRPVGRRGPITVASSDSYLSSLWSTQWLARLDGLPEFAARVPRGDGTPLADAESGVREDSDEYSVSAAVVEPVEVGDSVEGAPEGSARAAAAGAAAASQVFTAEEEVPLTSAWGVEDCSATLSAAFGVLAVTLEERRSDGVAALSLYSGSKGAIRHVRPARRHDLLCRVCAEAAAVLAWCSFGWVPAGCRGMCSAT